MSPCTNSLPFVPAVFAQLKVMHDGVGSPEEISKCTHAWLTAHTGRSNVHEWERFLVTARDASAQLLMIHMRVITVADSTDRDELQSGNDSTSNDDTPGGSGSLNEEGPPTKCCRSSNPAADHSTMPLERERYDIEPEGGERNTTSICFEERRVSLCLSYATTPCSPWLTAFALADPGALVDAELREGRITNAIKPCPEIPALALGQTFIYSVICWQDKEYRRVLECFHVRLPSVPERWENKLTKAIE